MRFDFAALAGPERYRLLTATVTPRPIAWVVTRNADGGQNLAPFSFFNVMGHSPPMLVLGLMTDAARGLKDTARNILARGDFTVNLVPEALAEAMNLTAIDAPHGVEEAALAGLELVPGRAVAAARLAAAPVAFECRLHLALTPGPAQTIVLGEVLAAEIADHAVLDAQRCHIDTAALHTIGRMGGAGGYTRTGDTFTMTRPVWAGYKP